MNTEREITIEFDWTPTSSLNSGRLFRWYSDSSNELFFYHDDSGMLTFSCKVGGATKESYITYPNVTGATYKIKGTIKNNTSIQVFSDALVGVIDVPGVPVITPTFTSGSMYGQVKNLRITDVPNPPSSNAILDELDSEILDDLGNQILGES